MMQFLARPLLLVLLYVAPAFAGTPAANPADPWIAKFSPREAPAPGPLLLREGDRLAIIGDSITEQKIYSRIMETYLTVCVPDLRVTARQYGWSGETAEGFRRRMTNDCLRFQPTVATLCYGMNDSRYRPFDEANGEWYRENYTAVARALKGAGARVVLGSPGPAGKIATWVKARQGTLEDHNFHLSRLRDIGLGIAQAEDLRFADVFWIMRAADFAGRSRYPAAGSEPYALTYRDGIHPGGAGHLVMAYSFLRALGLDGDLGRIEVDLAAGRAAGSGGHRVDAFANGELKITSSRYPFCAKGPADRDDSIRSGMTLVPFDAELNRLTLVVKSAPAGGCEVAWGDGRKKFTADQLAQGINLAAEFIDNPFLPAFEKVDAAVAAKQAYETRQVKQSFHGPDARADMEKVVAQTEAERAPLAAAIRAALVPVSHSLRITPAAP